MLEALGSPGRALGLPAVCLWLLPLKPLVPKFAGKGDPGPPRPPQDPPWKNPASDAQSLATGFRVLTLKGPVLVPRRTSPGTWPLVGTTVPLAVGRQASVLDRPAKSLSRGLSAALH